RAAFLAKLRATEHFSFKAAARRHAGRSSTAGALGPRADLQRPPGAVAAAWTSARRYSQTLTAGCTPPRHRLAASPLSRVRALPGCRAGPREPGLLSLVGQWGIPGVSGCRAAVRPGHAFFAGWSVNPGPPR